MIFVYFQIPAEFQGDPDIEAAQQECFELMEQFKVDSQEMIELSIKII